MGGADETGSFENRRHALGRVDKDAKGAPSKSENEVHQSEPRPHVPAIKRMCEGQQTPASRGGCAEQCTGVGITTHNAVEGNDVRFRLRSDCRGEVPENELSGTGAISRTDVTACDLKVGGRGIHKRRTSQANASKFGRNRANARADIEKTETVKRLAAEFA
jgi:hypothetical protein